MRQLQQDKAVLKLKNDISQVEMSKVSKCADNKKFLQAG